jgi:hypothetical protein
MRDWELAGVENEGFGQNDTEEYYEFLISRE